jgi:hypothetical protein
MNSQCIIVNKGMATLYTNKPNAPLDNRQGMLCLELELASGSLLRSNRPPID